MVETKKVSEGTETKKKKPGRKPKNLENHSKETESSKKRSPEEVGFDNMITDGAMRLVEEVVEKYPNADRNEILDHLSKLVHYRYPGESLEYHLSQMKMNTTKQILEVIDIFLMMREIEPDITFAKKPKK